MSNPISAQTATITTSHLLLLKLALLLPTVLSLHPL
jgi:hypothetical protein